MLRAIKIATLAAFVQIVEGHVRALPTDTGFGCRDCNGGAAPGPFRVNGPLGATKAFGANGAAKVKEGDEIALKIGYNGGHKSPDLNFFNVRYSCGDSTGAQGTFRKAGTSNKDQINCNAPCKQLTAAQIKSVDGNTATANNYPVDATNSNQGGYEVRFAMPEIEGTGDARKCTFSLVEGRDWGAAWDFEVEPKNTGAPGAGAGGQQPVQPAAPPPSPPKSVQGTYTLTPQNCQNDAPGCQCLTGSIQVYHTADAAEATVVANIVGYPPQNFPAKQKNKGAWSSDYVLGRCGVGDQELDLTLAPDAQATTGAILNVGVIANIPTVCGHIVKSTPLQGQAPQQQQPAIPICPGCADLPFTDKDNEGCGDFETCQKNDLWRIQPLLHYQKYPDVQTGKTARDQCCGCGGGTTKRQPIPPTTPAPTLAPVVPVPGQPGVPGQPVVGQPGVPGQPVVGQPGVGQPGVGQPGYGQTTRGGMFGGGAFVASAPGMDLAFGVVLTIFAGLFM